MELKNYTIKDIESMSAADLASFAEEESVSLSRNIKWC